MSQATDPEDGSGAAAPLDLLLTDAAQHPLRRFLPGISGVKFATRLATHPRTVARRGGRLAAEIGRIGVGRSQVAPHPKDRRFADEAWTSNPLLRRTVQTYLALGQTARDLVDDTDLAWADKKRVSFLVDNVIDASAPSNNPLLNPMVFKAVVDTGGRNLVGGARRFARDMATAPRVPSMVEPDAFEVGRDLAISPGSVVLRTDMFELIQYSPTTATVREVPLLIVPPTINKYYVIDLAPDRSLVEHLVASGQQVYCISWRNPDARHRDWGLDEYGAAVIEAMDAAQAISRQDRVALFALCSGGMLASMVLGHLAAAGDLGRVAAFSLAVTVIDQAQAGMPSALVSRKVAAAATKVSKEKGYLDGRMLAEVFAWLRPNDLVWNYWVSSYLLGRTPKAFDILFWNADPVRMTAAMHRDFMQIAVENSLTRPAATRMLGSDIDLGKVDTDSYLVAGIADHLCDWKACYQTTQLLGGESRFVLSTSGHIASMVNPPGNPKASFQTADHNPVISADFLAEAHTVEGTWWTDYVEWLTARTGPERNKPRKQGNAAYPVVCAAPGTYVHDS
ncbi:class II poly(R)-hydroxyalkanoic acid synthase [soil metagenome]